MKTAREMFEELGYEPYEKGDPKYKKHKIEYHDDNYWKKTSFIFCLKDKSVRKIVTDKTDYTMGTYGVPINSNEFKAINKQLEELGWLEDDN